MKGYKTTIETRDLTDLLKHKIQITTDEERVFLVVDYMGGRFIIEKGFKNNYIGLGQLERECERYNTEDKVVKYLGLGEKND